MGGDVPDLAPQRLESMAREKAQGLLAEDVAGGGEEEGDPKGAGEEVGTDETGLETRGRPQGIAPADIAVTSPCGMSAQDVRDASAGVCVAV
jgi:hypothetical protein